MCQVGDPTVKKLQWVLPKGIKGKARFITLNGVKRRLVLKRKWISETPFTARAVFIGMNPCFSTATHDGPTIRKEYLWAKSQGYTHYVKFNVCDAITPHSKKLRHFKRPCSNKNFNLIKRYVKNNDGKIVLAYGKLHESLLPLVKRLLRHLKKYHKDRCYCFKQNADGSAMHPLYLSPKKMKLQKFNWKLVS